MSRGRSVDVPAPGIQRRPRASRRRHRRGGSCARGLGPMEPAGVQRLAGCRGAACPWPRWGSASLPPCWPSAFTQRIAVRVIAASTALALLVAAGSCIPDEEGSTRACSAGQSGSILAAAPDGATVMSVGAPQPLVLGHLTNPSRYQMFTGGLGGVRRRHVPGRAAGLRRRHRSRSVRRSSPSTTRCGIRGSLEMLDRDYVRVGRTSENRLVRAEGRGRSDRPSGSGRSPTE